MAAEREAQRQQAFHVAAALAVAAHRDGRLAARQQDARRGEGLAAGGRLQRQAAQHLAHVACFAFERVAKNVRRVAG
jgi:hypothetical protein